MKALECPKCGAPVRGGADLRQATCRFCGTSLVREQRPVRPQPAAPALGGKQGLIVVAALAGVVVLGVAVALVAKPSGRIQAQGSAKAAEGATVAAAELATLSPAQSADAVAKQLGASVRDGAHVDVAVRDSPVERVHFRWEEKDHLTGVNLSLRSDAKRQFIVASLQKQLGRAFVPAASGHRVSVDGVGLTLSSTLSVRAHSRKDPRWKARFAALFAALKQAAFGGQGSLTLQARRDTLNLGYDLVDLKRVAPSMPLESSGQGVRAVFPGADVKGAAVKVGLEHPWFSYAALNWRNEARGKLSHVNLYFWTHASSKPQMQAVEKCLTPSLSAPKRQVMDHAAGKYNLDWPAKSGLPRVHVTPQLVMVFPNERARTRTTQAGWAKLYDALAGCG